MKNLPLKGEWKILLHDSEGNLKEKREGRNVITAVGKEWLAKFLSSSITAACTMTMNYIAIGTDSTAETAGDTALGLELARAAGKSTYTSGAILSITATFAAGTGTGAIAEYGLVNTATTAAGTLFSRDTEAVINKAAGDTLTVQTDITIS